VIYSFDDFELDAERLELRRSGRVLKAERTVLLTLARLLQEAGRLVTKDELVDAVWEGRAVADTVITVATARLRKLLGQRRGELEFIENVYGRGYRFVRTVVVSEAPARDAPAALEASSLVVPFVGRARVLHRLRQAFTRARGGRGQLCALIGEPGIGKTEVLEAFERERQSSEVRFCWGFCHELDDTPPLRPWQPAVRAALEVVDAAELEAALGPLAADLRNFAQAGAPGPGAGLDDSLPGSSRHRLFEAIARAITMAAERTPLVIVLDDLHRADLASVELLAQVVDALSRTRLLLLVTARSHAGQALEPHLSYALGHRNCERFVLEPLTPDDVAQYVGALLTDPDGSLGRAVSDKSEGNAFFMVELTRALCDMPTPRADALAVPEAALELVRQRIARLDAASRRVLSAAAIIGRSFEISVLQTATGSDTALLMANLDEALGAEVLEAAADSVTRFAFRHDLLRLSLYEALAPAERRRGHLRTAQALEERQQAGEAVTASELAFHYYHALPEGDPRKTVTYSRAAAATCSMVFANTEVVRHLRSALEALDLMPHPSVRLRMALLQLMSMHTRTTDPAEFRRLTQEIQRLARETGDAPNLIVAGGMLNPAPGLLPEPGAAETYAQALSLLDPREKAMRAIALAGLARAAPNCWHRRRVAAYLDEAVQIASELTSANVVHAVCISHLYLRGGPGHESEVRPARARLEELARTHNRNLPVMPAELHYARAITALQAGDRQGCTEALEAARARYAKIDQREGLWHSERGALLLSLQTDPDRARVASLLDLHERAERQSLSRTAAFRGFDRAVVLADLGHAPVLDEELRKALAPKPDEPPSIWALEVRALATAGWLDASHAALRRVAPEELGDLPHDRDYLGTLGHLARAAVLLGAEDYCRALLDLLAPHTDRIAGAVSFWPEGPVASLVGMLEAEFGHPERALAHFDRGIELAERCSLRLRADEARGWRATATASHRG